MQIYIHEVDSVELAVEYLSNGNSRTLRIMHGGGELELLMYGKTESVALLPRAADFKNYDGVALQSSTDQIEF